MEIIEVSSYTEKEKYQIASRFLLPKQIEEAALPEGLLRAVSYTHLSGLFSLHFGAYKVKHNQKHKNYGKNN